MLRVMLLTFAIVSYFSFSQTLDAQETNMGFQVSSLNPKSNEPLGQKSLEILQTPSQLNLDIDPADGQIETLRNTSALAQVYEKGLTAARIGKSNKANEIWMTLAAKGYAQAKVQLGQSYNYGRGVDQNFVRAAEWYRQAAVQGNADGNYFLGAMYKNGEGVPQDETEASFWWRKAAEQGHVLAQVALAQWYSDSSNDQINLDISAKLYEAAAKQGNTNAQIKLAEFYQFSRGVPQSNAVAHMWYNIAVATEKNARLRGITIQKRDRLGEYLGRADLLAAQRMASQCMRSSYKDCGY